MEQAHLDVASLYAALDEGRQAKELSWRQLAKEAKVSASTLTRMAQGKRPDVDSFAALVKWLGVPADSFLRDAGAAQKRKPEPLSVISTFLRADKQLSAESAAAIEDIVRAAYRRLKSP